LGITSQNTLAALLVGPSPCATTRAAFLVFFGLNAHSSYFEVPLQVLQSDTQFSRAAVLSDRNGCCEFRVRQRQIQDSGFRLLQHLSVVLELQSMPVFLARSTGQTVPGNGWIKKKGPIPGPGTEFAKLVLLVSVACRPCQPNDLRLRVKLRRNDVMLSP
jgi:hypothetical protein